MKTITTNNCILSELEAVEVICNIDDIKPCQTILLKDTYNNEWVVKKPYGGERETKIIVN